MRNVTQIARNLRLKGGGEAGTPDRKTPPPSRPKPFLVTPAYGSCEHSAPVGEVDGPSDRPATSCCAALAVCRSAGFWQANWRAST